LLRVKDNFRRAATYADRILKGAKPSELPVQMPIKYEMTINLKTAQGTWHRGAICSSSSALTK
jgi:ABC-type uncharacterized transport system substrate-binding protein